MSRSLHAASICAFVVSATRAFHSRRSNRHAKSLLTMGVLLIGAALAKPCVAGQAYFEIFPGHGTVDEVSADGTTVVGHSFSINAFRWSPPGALEPIFQTFENSYAGAMSDDESVILGASLPTNAIVFFLETNGSQIQMIDLPPGYTRGGYNDLSADGTVAVGAIWADDLHREAVSWSAATGTIRLGFLPSATGTTDTLYSLAAAITRDKRTIVGASTHGDGQMPLAVRWVGGQIMSLGDLPGGLLYSNAEDVSADGSVIVGSTGTDRGFEAFRWTEGEGMQSLWPMVLAYETSDDGSTIVGFGTGEDGHYKAMIWDAEHGTRRLQDVLVEQGLNLDDWMLVSAQSVSADGRTIVGYAEPATGLPNDQPLSTFYAVVPEPSSLALLAFALASLLLLNRRCFH